MTAGYAAAESETRYDPIRFALKLQDWILCYFQKANVNIVRKQIYCLDEIDGTKVFSGYIIILVWFDQSNIDFKHIQNTAIL